MKLLLDECLPVDFRHSFPDHHAHSAEWAGLKGRKNGELLNAAEANGYEVPLAVDHGMPRQQTITGRNLAVIPIQSRTNQLEDLLPLAPAILRQLDSIRPGEIALIAAPG
jgi:predicted nuclease of predicted toxin-antitoxin system